MYYEVLWYERDIYADMYEDELVETKEFKSKKAALNFYNKHKHDKEKYGWWITKRDEGNNILEDIIY